MLHASHYIQEISESISLGTTCKGRGINKIFGITIHGQNVQGEGGCTFLPFKLISTASLHVFQLCLNEIGSAIHIISHVLHASNDVQGEEELIKKASE